MRSIRGAVRRQNFTAGRQVCRPGLERLEARELLAADLQASSAKSAGDEKLGPFDLVAPSGSIVTGAASPRELLIAVAGDRDVEFLQAEFANTLELARLDLNGSISLQRLLTIGEADGQQTIVSLKLGESQDVLAAQEVFERIPAVVWTEPNYACSSAQEASANPVPCDTPLGKARAYLMNQAESFGLDSPDLSDVTHVFSRELSFGSVERFQQHVRGIPVYEAEIAVTVHNEGKVSYAYSAFQPDVQLADDMPAIEASTAREIALNTLNIAGPLSHDSTRLIVFPISGAARLAFQVELVPMSGDIGDFEVIVDADSGAVLQAIDRASQATGAGLVFNPDPLTSANVAYGATGYSDASDADVAQLNAQRQSVTLPDITLNAGTYSLVGPYAQIVDTESPLNGLFSQASNTFNFTRNQSGFEAVNTYYHLDRFMRYLNVTLGLNVAPRQYAGGVKFDPHGLSGDDNSHYLSATGVLAFGEGGVDDAEDADVIIHELGHGIHDWVTGGNLSQVNGLSEGVGDYFAQSYSRVLGLWPTSNPAYHYTFSWDGHNEYWSGRTTNYSAAYPGGLTGSIHTDGQIWATANMKVWDVLGAAKTDAMMIEGLAMTGSSTNQQQAAQALVQAAVNRGYTTAELNSIISIYQAAGYIVTLPTPPTQLSGTVWNDLNGNRTREASESGLAGWTVYLDANGNGARDSQTGNRASTDVPKTIADLSTVTSQTVVTGFAGNITDLNVTLSLTHTYDSDLIITLIAPGGQRVELANRIGGSGNNFTSTVFDQQAATSITSGSPPFTGTFRPQGSLSALNGTAANGTWRLEIVDAAGGDTGSLSAWSLQFATGETSTTTSATGSYLFNGLTAGSFVVREELQAAWTQTLPITGSHAVTLASGQTLSGIDFANFQTPTTLRALNVTPTSTGAVIDLSHAFEVAPLNLYDVEGVPLGPSDVTLIGATAGNVRGSLVAEPNLRRVTFVASNGILVPDTYTLTLRSAADGFLSASVGMLDGDANGTAGGNYVYSFMVSAPPLGGRTVSLPNFVRGPQQAVNVPATQTAGIPLSLSDGDGVTSVSLDLRYDPALLTISAATVAPGLPAGASVTLNTSTPGVATIQFTSPTPLTSSTTRFVDLQASVPASVIYRSKHVLDLSNVMLNGGTLPAIADDAVHVVAYFGDLSGNGNYGASDAARIARVTVGLDSGSADFRLLDPFIIADVSGNGLLSSSDASRVLQAAVGFTVPEIPALPTPAASIVQGGPDPKLSIPADLVATAGGALQVPVNIDSIVDLTGSGLDAADLVLYYDPAVLDVTNVVLGSLLTSATCNWFVASNIDPLAGRIFISLASTVPVEGFFQGELVQLQTQVKSSAPLGASAINLAASSRDPSRFTQLNDGYLTLIPAPTDAANDPGVDGVVTILPNPTAQAAVERAAVSMAGDRLLITGTAARDHILIGWTSQNQIRVRIDDEILGDYSPPAGIVIQGQGGDDVVSFAAGIPTADVELLESEPARVFRGATSPRSSAGEFSATDLALLELLAGSQQTSDSRTGRIQRGGWRSRPN